ncbi:MAG: sigma-70 family RNA polymerase sigma factor [Actinobacteria bacterium]|nr:sigma-70 family RNA polymerase sigma factor [Actinomycetota bacterium]
MTASARVDEFEALRPHLLAVAYRLTGTFADAEDIVQDAWLRWDRDERLREEPASPDERLREEPSVPRRGEIADLRAWLTTVVSRLSLDRLRSAAHRREAYVGEWLPEPVVTGLDGDDPLSVVVAGEDARFAAMVVLERLNPAQRVAFVLREGFGVPFAEIADVLGVSVPAARQLASRARRVVGGPDEPLARRESSPDEPPRRGHDEVVGALLAALAAGDVDAVVALLHGDVTLVGDSNGKTRTAIREIRGPDRVARFLFGLARRYGPGWLESSRAALVNGELGAYSVGTDGGDGFDAAHPRVVAVSVRDGKVGAVWDIANPDKFTGSPLRASSRPTGSGRHPRS